MSHFLPHSLTLCCHGCRLLLSRTGLRDFVGESVKLAYGEDSPLVANKQVAAVQSLSGTGSCRLFAEYQKRFLPNSSIYIPVVSDTCIYCKKNLVCKLL
jgi:aspartate/tyrosine/aromatic aminotransferase